MKKVMGALCAACLLAGSCGNKDEEKAQLFLQEAESAWQAGDYGLAKIRIDSIRVCCPKAFEGRRQGIELMRKVELDEERKNVAYLDSLMQARQAEFEAMKGNFVLEKDTLYQEAGNYFSPSQTVEKNLRRTFLRAQVSERGAMLLTSVYCGERSIHHTSVRVSAGGTYAETPESSDTYESEDLGWKTEKVDYPLGKDGGVIGYIVLNKDLPIQAELRGDRSFRTAMTPADRKAVADVYALAQVLSSIEEIKKSRQEAERKIEFIRLKMEESTRKGAER